MNAILIAYEGHIERLKAIHGSPEDNTQPIFRTPPKRKGRVLPQHPGDTPRMLTPAAFDAAFGTRKKNVTIPSPFKKGR